MYHILRSGKLRQDNQLPLHCFHFYGNNNIAQICLFLYNIPVTVHNLSNLILTYIF